MRELFGRLIDLDPTAGDDLLVIDYFDRLTAAQVGVERLLKEAALLARTTVGLDTDDRSLCVLASGSTAGAMSSPDTATTKPVGTRGLVWMDISTSTAPSAEMVLERLALALSIAIETTQVHSTPSAVEILVSTPPPGEPPLARQSALGRLRLETNGIFRAIALPLTEKPPPGMPQSVVDTSRGPLRAVIARAGFEWTGVGGVGTPADGENLHLSWINAMIALRLSDGKSAFEADRLGSLLTALKAHEGTSESRSDVESIRRALDQRWSLEELQAVSDGLSLRQIAAVAGLHHSTVQSKLMRLESVLGFSPLEPLGRHRLAFGLLLHRVSWHSRA